MTKTHIIIAATMGMLGVALGAFGAHGLKNIITPKLLETYNTGVFYHLIHAVVLLAISLNNKYNLKLPFLLILLGIVLFSFSLYIYSITQIKFLVFITPIGGTLLIIGWLSVIYKTIKN